MCLFRGSDIDLWVLGNVSHVYRITDLDRDLRFAAGWFEEDGIYFNAAQDISSWMNDHPESTDERESQPYSKDRDRQLQSRSLLLRADSENCLVACLLVSSYRQASSLQQAIRSARLNRIRFLARRATISLEMSSLDAVVATSAYTARDPQKSKVIGD